MSKGNYYSYLPPGFNEGYIPNKEDLMKTTKYHLHIDSRERNKSIHPTASDFKVQFNKKFKNLLSIELTGMILPKTEWNVNSGNNKIDFNIGSTITNATLVSGGSGYANNGTHTVNISAPTKTGTQATVDVTVAGGVVTGVAVNNAGSGYTRGNYNTGTKKDDNTGGGLDGGYWETTGATFVHANLEAGGKAGTSTTRAVITLTVGAEKTAVLRPGLYDFEETGNQTTSGKGLCDEVARALKAADAGSDYFCWMASNVNLNAITGSDYATTNKNSGECNQMVIRRNNGGDNFLELLWGSGTNNDNSAIKILGFGSHTENYKGVSITPPPMDQVSFGNAQQAAAGTLYGGILARNTPNLTDTCEYVAMHFNPIVDRIESNTQQLDKAFGTIIFDANSPDWWSTGMNFANANSTTSSIKNLKSGCCPLKAIRGGELDKKIYVFNPPDSSMESLQVSFRKMNGDLYNFHGREILLIFTILCKDVNSGNRY
jgi:hypothetical protein